VGNFGAEADEKKPSVVAGLLPYLYCFNYTGWRETTLPSIFSVEVVGE
jgi:hypothetical protein